MGINSLSVQIREVDTKSRVKKLRQAGLAPGVIYGGAKSNIPIQFNGKELEKLLKSSRKGMNTLIEMEVRENEAETVMIRELFREPTTGSLLHVDFYRVSLSERLQTEVQLAWVGEASGVKQGGLMQPGLRSVLVECLPAQIPDRLEVLVTDLEVGDKLTVADLTVPAGIRILTEPDEVVVSILAARVEAEPADTPAPVGEKAEETPASVQEADAGKLAAK